MCTFVIFYEPITLRRLPWTALTGCDINLNRTHAHGTFDSFIFYDFIILTKNSFSFHKLEVYTRERSKSYLLDISLICGQA
jgi:hypothetical protein